MECKVDLHGRVTIPIELRRKLGLRAGTRLIMREENDRIVVMTMAQYVHSLRGVLRGKGEMEGLREERRREAEG